MRSFKVFTVNKKSTKHHGRYMAASHSAAAKKAFSKFCKREKRKSRCGASITMVETTRGSAKKKRAYNLAREILKPPVKTKNATFKYKTVVKAASQ